MLVSSAATGFPRDVTEAGDFASASFGAVALLSALGSHAPRRSPRIWTEAREAVSNRTLRRVPAIGRRGDRRRRVERAVAPFEDQEPAGNGKVCRSDGLARGCPAPISRRACRCICSAATSIDLNGRDQDAAAELDAIERLIQSGPRRYATAEGFVTIGRFFLLRGADARKVLDQFYDVVTKQQPDFLEAYFATAELALEKEDYALAAETLRKAPKAASQDPRFHYLLARALSAEDRAGSAKALAEALKINPRHVDSLLLQADQLIDGERYAEAEQMLKQVLDVNPLEPRAWAYRAVLAHLRGDQEGEASARRIGAGAVAIEPRSGPSDRPQALAKIPLRRGGRSAEDRHSRMDPDYLPAKVQLCQDLLRLGEETEGWKLAAEIFSKDGYNVVAYNLITLRDRLAGFRTLEGDGFVVRMDKREADLYGPRVLALLTAGTEDPVRKVRCHDLETR